MSKYLPPAVRIREICCKTFNLKAVYSHNTTNMLSGTYFCERTIFLLEACELQVTIENAPREMFACFWNRKIYP